MTSNLVWDKETVTSVVSLLDFGHAQPEDDARSYGGTDGYEAPEFRKENGQRHPHSRASDAYSVGKTLLKVAKVVNEFRVDDTDNTCIEEVKFAL